MKRQEAIILTGGAGFIGTALLPELRSLGQPIILIDSLLDQVHPGGAAPAGLPDDTPLVVADIAKRATWDEVLAGFAPSTVIHLAAETGTGQSLTEATRHATTNVVGTTAMLDAFVRHDLTPRHLVLTSSRAIYGEGSWVGSDGERFSPEPRSHRQLAAGVWDHTDALDRPASPAPSHAGHTVPNPSSVYGSTKLTQELILKNWGAAFSVPVSILRLQNVYGPGQSPTNPYTGITTLFHRLASQGKTLEVYEDGQIGRDFVFIDDVAAALLSAVKNPPPHASARTLDVGTGVVTTILDAANQTASMYGAPEPRISGNFRDGDVRFAVADIADTEQALGWHPQISFEEGNRRLSHWLADGGYLGN